MTALILVLIWLSQVLPVVSNLPEPLNVTVNSNHLHHMLQWEAGEGTPRGVYYKVTFITHKESSWKPVVDCQHVQQPLVCNLTAVLSNPEETYFVKVVAVLDNHFSKTVSSHGFQPSRDTHLDPPLLTVTSCGLDLCLNLDPPMERIRAIYDKLKYQLRITSTNADTPRLKEITSLEKEILKDLPRGREYCISIKVAGLLYFTPRTSNFSQPKCVFIPGPLNTVKADCHPPGARVCLRFLPVKNMFFLTAVTIHKYLAIAAALCLLVIFILVIWGFLHCAGFVCLKKRPLPLVLVSIRHTDEVLHFPPLTLLSSILSVKPTAPPAGKKKSSQTESSDSDEESDTETTGGGKGRGEGYKLRVGTNLLSSSSSSSSSSLAAPLSPNGFPTNQNTLSVPPDVFSALSETAATASTSIADSVTTKRTETEEEEEEEEEEEAGVEEGMRERDSKDVNLLTLTFGNHKKEEEPPLIIFQSPPPASEETSGLLTHTCHFIEANKHSDICSNDEEEEDECDGANGYMRR